MAYHSSEFPVNVAKTLIRRTWLYLASLDFEASYATASSQMKDIISDRWFFEANTQDVALCKHGWRQSWDLGSNGSLDGHLGQNIHFILSTYSSLLQCLIGL